MIEPDSMVAADGSLYDEPLYEGMLKNMKANVIADLRAVNSAVGRGMPLDAATSLFAGEGAKKLLCESGIEGVKTYLFG